MIVEIIAVSRTLGQKAEHDLICRGDNGKVFTMRYEDMHPDTRPSSPVVGKTFEI